MDNQQFRRLVLKNPSTQQQKDGGKTPVAATPRSATLGSRMRSSIPMTPRSVGGSTGVDFARQLAERNRESQPLKKFKSSAAPKGTKLPTGYRDRTLDREASERNDVEDKAARIQALEESMKLGQIDQDTFERLRDKLVGGDIQSTHLIKGLDFKLLERIRRGEDVLNDKRTAEERAEAERQEKEQEAANLEDEFEKFEEQEVAPVIKQKTEKKGEMAPPPPPGGPTVAGRKRTRDQILAELKAARQAAKEQAAQPSLGPKFRKVGEQRNQPNTSRIERDEKGREVLITVDEDGNVKRKVRRVKEDDSRNRHFSKAARDDEAQYNSNGLLMPDKDAQPLGMDVSHIPGAVPTTGEDDDDDGDIFEDAGVDYDPLADLGDEDSSSSEEEGEETTAKEQERKPTLSPSSSPSEQEPSKSPDISSKAPTNEQPATKKIDYFASSSSKPTASTDGHDEESQSRNPLKDPAILAALKKASSIAPIGGYDDDEEGQDAETRAKEREAARRRQRLLEQAAHDRDAEDMDLGFGSSRMDDEEDMDESKVKLSAWTGLGGGDDEDDGDGAGARGGKQKRKRGPKKKKGDVNNAADVMKVLERRKGN
ncbi:hypothetical protein L228DRAFT_261558 [Xylona heveae TC161]|uniref:RED-like N-terminal domain-containing protein n=1 Tax=Xylona heveae (strain CBS 132557 / TC161) TaxID=1328760 RepID=A0A165GMW0_XYLHT|nr:hypothetical protein L228DRAFT_261558 [Xylona heveae TC161]KZF22385.1 hypothetical protein L228DRAFT_261558 [Xylona heveae TC161]